MTNREIAEKILSNCALHYSSPENWMGRTPQETIDLAITNAESILSKHLEGESHPYHEACPKCLNTKHLLQKRLARFEAEVDGIRQAMGLSAAHYDTPEKIADAVKTRILHWLEVSQASPDEETR
jgi:hypothetical protein